MNIKTAVVGIGGHGKNTIEYFQNKKLQGIEMFFVANTDHIDSMESGGDLRRKLAGVDVLFLIAGMGGGYGTRAAPEIARIARELNILTIAWVTKPFTFEGARRAILARQGIEELQRWTDACIVIPTQTFSA